MTSGAPIGAGGRWLGSYTHPRLIRRWPGLDVFCCLNEDGVPRLAVVAPEADRNTPVLERLTRAHRQPQSRFLARLLDERTVGATRLWVFDFRAVTDVASFLFLPGLSWALGTATSVASVLASAWSSVERLDDDWGACPVQMGWESVFVDRRGRMSCLALPGETRRTDAGLPTGLGFWRRLEELKPLCDVQAAYVSLSGTPDWSGTETVGQFASTFESLRVSTLSPRGTEGVSDELAAAVERTVVREGLLAADLPRTLNGRYTIDRVIAGGGGTTVALARDLRDDTLVAIKSLPSTAPKARRARFRREARLSVELEHPALMAGKGLLEVDGRLHAVLDRIEGPTLRRWWMTQRPTLLQLVQRLGQVAEGLAALAEAAVVHGDVKPSNVVLHPTRGAVLVDYGVARWQGAPPMSEHETERSDGGEASALALNLKKAGSWRYMAPETRRMGLNSPASDIFAWAVMAAELLAGQESTLGRHVVDPVATPEFAGLPRGLAEVVESCLAAEPEHRPRAHAVVKTLRTVAEDLAQTLGRSVTQRGESSLTQEDVVPIVWVAQGAGAIHLPNGRRVRLGAGTGPRRCFAVLLDAWSVQRGQWQEASVLAAKVWPQESEEGRAGLLSDSLEQLQMKGLGGMMEVGAQGVRLLPELEFAIDP